MARILIVHDALDDAHPLDIAVARLATGLAAKGEVTLLLATGAAGGEVVRTLPRGLALVTAARARRRGGRRALVGALPPLVQRLRADAPDIVLATGLATGLLAGAARIAAGRPGKFYVKLDRPPAGGFGGAIGRRLHATLFGEAARVLVPSDADRRAMAAAFPGQGPRFLAVAEPVVPDGRKAPPPPRRTGDRRRIVTIAGPRTPALAAALPADARLVVVGGTPGLAGDRIETVPAGSLAAHLRDADLFVLTDAAEALPPTLVEALAADRAVVSTDRFASARDLLDGAPGCAVIRDGDLAAALGPAIATALAHGPRPSLRPIAERHGVAAAVQAHGWAMGVL